jgi:Protein of unknown function (DUF2490)
MRKHTLLLFTLLSFAAAAEDRPTDHHAHAWLAYFGDHPIANSKWGMHAEAQVRRHNFGASWQQLLIRPGVNFQVNSKLMLTGGYAFVRSHRYNDYVANLPATNEHRIWQQAWFRYGSRVRWSTRLRFENRFIGTVDAAGKRGSRFENRFRAWQQITLPVSERVYVTGYDEVWFYVKPYLSNSAFDQNRAYGGVGFKASPHLRLEAGYMNQTLLHRSGARLEQNHTLMISVFSDGRIFAR